MSFVSSTYHSPLYQAFKDLEASDYRRIARFYEMRQQEIRRLNTNEYVELLVLYTSALFEIGAYERLLIQVDFALELSIFYNIQYLEGEDIYCKLLFQKTAAHYNLMDYRAALHVGRELLKLYPSHELTAILIRKILYEQQSTLLRTSKAAGVACFLLTGIVIAIELLLVKHFYPESVQLLRLIRSTIFILGVLLLVAGELYFRYSIQQQVDAWIAEAHNKKRNSLQNKTI